MRTLILDNDVAAKLRAEARRSGLVFESVGNEAIRRGLVPSCCEQRQPFVVRSKPLGLREGLSYENIEELLDEVEEPARR